MRQPPSAPTREQGPSTTLTSIPASPAVPEGVQPCERVLAGASRQILSTPSVPSSCETVQETVPLPPPHPAPQAAIIAASEATTIVRRSIASFLMQQLVGIDRLAARALPRAGARKVDRRAIEGNEQLVRRGG